MKNTRQSLILTFVITTVTLFSGCGTSFIEAVKEGKTEVVEEKIKSNADDVNLSDGIFFACREGKIDVVKLLLINGADPNDNNNDWTPLYLAANNRHLHIAKFLIDNGADVNKVCNSEARIIKNNQVEEKEGKFYYQFVTVNKGETPLSAAVSKGDESIVKVLLKNGANPNTSVIWDEAYHNCGGGFAAEGYSFTSAVAVGGIVRTAYIDKNGNTESNVRPSFDKSLSMLELSDELGFKDISKLLLEYGAQKK
jgi:ankyrin repeat protein